MGPVWGRAASGLMDGTPLDKAYTAAKNGDAAVLGADYKKAAAHFSAAADYFEQVRSQSLDNPSSRTLQALAEQYRKRAEYFRSGKAATDTRKSGISPASSITSTAPPLPGSGGAAAAAAAAAGGPNTGRAARRAHDAPATSTYSNQLATSGMGAPPADAASGLAAPLGEVVNSLVARSAAVFARTFEQSIAEHSVATSGPGPLSAVNAPSESFYLVKPKGSEGKPATAPAVANNRITITSYDRTQAIEQAMNAQRVALKSGLRRVMNDVASREQQINDEHTEEVDRLRAENDRLKIQISKLKSRWEELKESARKRQSSE